MQDSDVLKGGNMDEQLHINIAKSISGEASEAELRQLKEWLSADPKNKAEYEQLKAIWGQSDDILTAPGFDTGAAWAKVSGQLQLEKTGKRSILFSPWLRYTMAAAAVLILGVFIVGRYQANEVVTIAAADGNMNIDLPDNSHITLRKGSTLSYPSSFSGNERRVALQGEAFFDVTRNEQKPFVIDAQSATVQVLGTSFDVKCSQAYATVVVKTGKVQMSDNKTAASVILTPGEKGVLKNGQLVEQSARIDNILYWQTGVLKYTQTPLADIIDELSQIKDTSIVLDQNMAAAYKTQLVTFSISGDQPLDSMLKDLCLVSQCQWSRNGDSYRVSSK